MTFAINKEGYKKLLKLSVLKDRFTFNEALCLWLELAPNGDDIQYLDAGYSHDGDVVSGYITRHFQPLDYDPYWETTENMRKKAKLETMQLQDNTIKQHTLLTDAFKTIANESSNKSSNCLNPLQLSREQLKKVAKLLNEKPVFLFPEKAGSTTIEKPLDQRERTSLHILIVALAKHSKLEPNDRDSTGKIKRQIDSVGLKMSEDSIRKHLKAAFETLANKAD